ncbi:MAG: hypothetical protein WDO14_08155 [Bacteroidota bacterium]
MKTLVSVFFVLLTYATKAQAVGEIPFDPKRDDPKFQMCNPNWVWQGYQLKTKMDETPLLVAREFKSQFRTKDEWKNESGIIRVRFLVNCNGQSDRFRLLGLDFDLNEKKFSETLSAHVLSIAKNIQWPSRRVQQQTVDYYHHFSIRIVNGQLVDIIQ